MMKKLAKALLGLIAAVAMLFTGLALPSSAVAAETGNITITGVNAGDTFSAWRMLNATTSDGGKNVSYTETSSAKTAILKNAYNAVETDDTKKLGDQATVSDVVAALATITSNSETMVKFAQEVKAGIAAANPAIDADLTTTADDATAVFSNVPAGYYIIEQTNKVEGEDKAASALIVDTAGSSNVTVAAKSDVPTHQKKVQEKNDSTGNTSGWQDGADYDIGDMVPFQITGTLPSGNDFAEKFAAYKTYKFVFHDKASDGLTFDKDKADLVVKVGNQTVATNKYTVETSPADNDTFDVTLSDIKSLTDNDGQTITVGPGTSIVVEYKMQLNENAVIGGAGNPNVSHLEYSNNPNTGHEGETGTTPEDKVVVWTYNIVANKTDGKNPLEGAGFTLYKKVASYTTDDGAGTGWQKVKEIAPTDTDKPTKFEFKGQDAGDYKLVETTVPDGYNKAADIEFTITATYDTNSDNPKLTDLTVTVTSGSATFTPNTNNGVISTDVVNKSGSELPETGGIGTTILYVAGAACVIAAGVWFGLRRRNSTR